MTYKEKYQGASRRLRKERRKQRRWIRRSALLWLVRRPDGSIVIVKPNRIYSKKFGKKITYFTRIAVL